MISIKNIWVKMENINWDILHFLKKQFIIKSMFKILKLTIMNEMIMNVY